MKVWLSVKQESELKKIGFDFPNFPKQGDAYYDGKKIGYVTNFDGLALDDCESKCAKLLKSIKENLNLCIWNPDKN